MKKYRLLLLLSALLFFLGACGEKKQETGSESKESTVRQSKASSVTSEAKKAESSSEKKEKTKMDIEAIAQGDYSSVAGVWQDDKGNKLVSNEYESYGLSLTDYGTVSGGVYGGITGGFLMEFIPAGLTIDDQTDENGEVVFHDDSDASKDRLWTGTGMYSFTEQGSFLYKVGD